MVKTYYRFKFYLNALHSVKFAGKVSAIHPHTWEISILFRSRQEETVNFSSFETELESYFLKFEGKFLNELVVFKGIIPTMENIGKILFEDVKKLINDRDLDFKTFEISENPARTYIIEDD